MHIIAFNYLNWLQELVEEKIGDNFVAWQFQGDQLYVLVTRTSQELEEIAEELEFHIEVVRLRK